MRAFSKALALLLATILLFTACAPIVEPPSCDGEHIDEGGDLICDNCGETLEAPNCDEGHTDLNDDLVCDICGEALVWEVDSFLPVLRFAITSDVHVRSTNNDYDSARRLERFLGSAYEYSEDYKSYTSLDGIFIIGDLTQDGKTQEYQIAKQLFNRIVDDTTVLGVTMGNHEFHAYGTGDERFTAENIAKSTARFVREMGYESENWHKVIGGYHFISIANDTYNSRDYFDEETIEWLRGEIEAAMADDQTGNKPIFVMNHEGPLSEVRGFTGGDAGLGEFLKDYPRVVDFSGHTHRSILDPQSIWQDGFTAIGTGGLAYLGYNMAGHPTLNNSAVTGSDMDGGYVGGGNTGARTGAMYYIVEVDAENNIRLRIYDLLTESLYGEPIIFKVGADEEEIFTPEREAVSVAPIFPEDAKIEVISNDYNLPQIKFTIPTGGELTQYYRFELTKEGESEPSLIFYRLGAMHNAAMGLTETTAPIRGHEESGKYLIKIYAVNCWGKESLPLEGEITIAPSTLTPDILNTTFNTDGTATNGESTLPITTTLSGDTVPVVSFDEELGRNIATFDGNCGYKFADIKNYYDAFVYSLSIEAYFRAGETDASVAIGSNTQSAGFGLVRTADGRVQFVIRFNNGVSKYLYASTAEGTAPIGEWVHAVVSYDNARGIMIYINGEQATLYDEDGNEAGGTISCSGRLFHAPTGIATSLIVGGDINKSGLVESGFVGDIAAYNIFSRPLTAEEALALYNQY